jgi:DNA modification methylase
MTGETIRYNGAAFDAGQRTPDAVLARYVPDDVLARVRADQRRAIPALAKDPKLVRTVTRRLRDVPTCHLLARRDSRALADVPDGSVHLVVTSPPYWTLKAYESHADQLGVVEDYETFLDELDRVWEHAHRVLVPGGRLVVVVGDVCLSRRQYGRHVVFPLHASIQERCRALGFDNLAPIIWHKIANATLEATGNGGGFLGKPYEPNAVVKNDVEYILFQRKPGGYRKATSAMRALSVIPEDEHRVWFQQIWTLGGASTRHHPAPYPVELAERLVRMFSFVGDVVLDPFSGTGTTSLAAAHAGRNSIAVEVEPRYHAMAVQRLREARQVRLALS